MESGSGSFTESRGSSSSSQPNSSTESLNGLKFGQKIYFEDLGLGAQSKSVGGSSSSAATPPKKVRGSAFQVGQPPRCQVEGCNVDLSDAKAYYSRHKVCGTHSKSPKVIVAGLEQRFCQQCSRFHLLPEFDQGKRSCRRRLAGHNERRRKPQTRSLSSMHYGRLSSSFFGNSNKVGSFLMDFSSYPKSTGRDLWSSVRSSERVPVNETNTAAGKYHPYLLQKNSENSLSSSDLFLQSSSGGTAFSDPGMPSGECITGVTDSSCALSLLSNQPWSSGNRTSSFGMNGTMHAQAAPTGHITTNGAAVSHIPAPSWGVKTAEAIPSSHEIAMDLGLCQMSQPLQGTYAGEVELPQLSRRQYMEFGYSRTLDSTQQMHWSL